MLETIEQAILRNQRRQEELHTRYEAYIQRALAELSSAQGRHIIGYKIMSYREWLTHGTPKGVL